MSTLSTVPPMLEIGNAETRTWPLDTTPTMFAIGGMAFSNPGATVVDPVTDLPVAGIVQGTPTLVGKVITATFAGATLTFGKTYQIKWTLNVDGQVVEWVTQLNVVA